MRWITAVLLGLALAISIAARFFHLFQRTLAEQMLMLGIPAIGFGILLFQAFPLFDSLYKKTSARRLIAVQSLLAAVFLAVWSGDPVLVRGADFVSVAGLSFGLLLTLAAGLDYVIQKGLQGHLLAGWLMSIPAGFLLTGYLGHFYPAWLAPVIALLMLTITGAASFLLIRHARPAYRGVRTLSLLTVSAALAFALAVVGLGLGYPNLFDRGQFLPDPALATLFWPLALLAPASIARALQAFEEHSSLARWRESRWRRLVRENLPGILLASAFFLAYVTLSHVFNRPGMDLTENFFAADNFAWISRLTSPDVTGIEMRAVHPFAYFIFRPVVRLLSLLFNGDRVAATLLLVPFTGGLCVLLTWLLVNRWTGSRDYALLVAALLGVSTSHLVFGSIVESYIFSAAVLLLFFLLLADEKTPLTALVATGAVIFGITITNFIQTFIGFILARPKLRAIFIYGLMVSAVSITLTVLHAAAYPSALMFFVPSDAAVENEYSISILAQPAWRLIGRTLLLARTILLYSLVAPQPFILTEEVGGYFPRFNFFKLTPGTFHYSGYEGLGQILIAAWTLLLLAAGLAFMWNLIRTRKAGPGLTLLLCILFNFALHMGYGFEPFLYSADWTYALVLFVAVSLSGFANDRWFRAALYVFIVLLMINQWIFLQLIFRAISPFL